MEKKGGELWPCIDHRSLKQVTDKYHLPLVHAALEQVEAEIVTELNLQSTYNLVCIYKVDKWKTILAPSLATLSTV